MTEVIAFLALFVSLATFAMQLTGGGALKTLNSRQAYKVQVAKRKLGGAILWFLVFTIVTTLLFLPNLSRLMAGEPPPIGWTDWLGSIFAVGVAWKFCTGLWYCLSIGWVLSSPEEFWQEV